jgi:hypothetical protein
VSGAQESPGLRDRTGCCLRSDPERHCPPRPTGCGPVRTVRGSFSRLDEILVPASTDPPPAPWCWSSVAARRPTWPVDSPSPRSSTVHQPWWHTDAPRVRAQVDGGTIHHTAPTLRIIQRCCQIASDRFGRPPQSALRSVEASILQEAREQVSMVLVDEGQAKLLIAMEEGLVIKATPMTSPSEASGSGSR